MHLLRSVRLFHDQLDPQLCGGHVVIWIWHWTQDKRSKIRFPALCWSCVEVSSKLLSSTVHWATLPGEHIQGSLDK